MKYYKLLREFNGALAGDILIQDEETNSYVLHKVDVDFGDNREMQTSIYMLLPAEFVENRNDLFEEVGILPYEDTKAVKEESVTTKSATEIQERVDAILEVLKGLVSLYGEEFEGASNEMLMCVADLQAELSSLNWTLNK